MKHLAYIILLFCAPALTAQKVVSINLDATINPATAGYIERGIETASRENAECLLIHLNTPGGLLKSTRVIVADILESPVPVIVYVSPGGAHAGSAGVFITMASHIAVMAPGTNMGAAHPVGMQEGDTVMSAKVTNDAAAFIRTIAQKRHRNGEWAEQAVRQSVSLTEQEALDKNVVDLVATNVRDLLQQVDGRAVLVANGSVTLHTTGAGVENLEMSFMEKMLNLISDPNVAYILMMLGFYGLLFELYSPGTIFPGVVGVICLILAFYAMHTLPVNYAGVALIVFALVLFLLELKITSGGILGIGGIVSLLIGSLMLIRTDAFSSDIFRMSKVVIFSSVAITTLFFFFVIGIGVKALRRKPVSGAEGMEGETGKVLTSLSPRGTVLVHGEIWQAEAPAGVLEEGREIRVLSMKNFVLQVEPIHQTS